MLSLMYRCYRRQKQLSNHKLQEAKEQIPMEEGSAFGTAHSSTETLPSNGERESRI